MYIIAKIKTKAKFGTNLLKIKSVKPGKVEEIFTKVLYIYSLDWIYKYIDIEIMYIITQNNMTMK